MFSDRMIDYIEHLTHVLFSEWHLSFTSLTKLLLYVYLKILQSLILVELF